mgnify:CR=1 FL=1
MENAAQPPNTRTFMCAVVFIDIIEYSKKPVARQLVIKQRFNTIVGKGLENVPTADRIILDTGDGAALCFLGDPEDALFVTNSIRNDFATETEVPELKVRIGINLGPVKVMRDLNGNPNIVGDGINVAQRVMSFAQTNQILVSRSYYEVVSRLTQEYSQLFRFIGAREDKHVREHELYEVAVGGAQESPAEVIIADLIAPQAAPQPQPQPQPQPTPARQAVPSSAAATPATPPSAPVSMPPAETRRSNTGLIIGATAAICLSIGAGAWFISNQRSSAPEPEKVVQKQEVTKETPQPNSQPVTPAAKSPAKAREHVAAPKRQASGPAPAPAPAPSVPPQQQAQQQEYIPPAVPQSDVYVNGRQLSVQELQQHQAIYNTPVQAGRYWYDPTSGLYGHWGREAIGYIRTGHGYGPVPANASNGNTGIYINGRHINTVELTRWQALFRQVIQPGRYWLDGNTGNVGVEGNPTPTGNVRAAIQASRGHR